MADYIHPRIHLLNELVNKLQSEAADNRDKINELKQENRNAKTQVTNLEADLKKAKDTLSTFGRSSSCELCKKHVENITHKNGIIRERETKIEDLEKQVRHQRRRRDEAEDDLEDAKKELKDVRRDAEAKKKELEDLRKDNYNLRQSDQRKDDEIRELKIKLTISSNQANSHKSFAEEQSTKVFELQGKLNTVEYTFEENHKLKKRIEDLEETVAKQGRDLAEAATSMIKIVENTELKLQPLEQIKLENENLKNDLQKSNMNLANIGQLKTKIKSLENQVQTRKLLIQQQSEKLDEHEKNSQKLAGTTAENQKLKKELEEQEEIIARQIWQLNEAASKISESAKKAEQTLASLNKAKQENADLQKELQEQKDVVSSRNRELITAATTIKELTNNTDLAKQEIANLQQDLQTLNTEFANVSKERCNLQAFVNDLALTCEWKGKDDQLDELLVYLKARYILFKKLGQYIYVKEQEKHSAESIFEKTEAASPQVSQTLVKAAVSETVIESLPFSLEQIKRKPSKRTIAEKPEESRDMKPCILKFRRTSTDFYDCQMVKIDPETPPIPNKAFILDEASNVSTVTDMNKSNKRSKSKKKTKGRVQIPESESIHTETANDNSSLPLDNSGGQDVNNSELQNQNINNQLIDSGNSNIITQPVTVGAENTLPTKSSSMSIPQQESGNNGESDDEFVDVEA